MLKIGYLDSFNKGLQEAGINESISSKEDIGKMIREAGITKQTIEKYASALIKAGWGKINTENGTLESFTVDGKQFGLSGVLGFRQGLAKVPYDDYPAVLHEGEAVLTSSTANELRNLLSEYRANNQAVITLDTTIQNQTVALVSKLDEVVSAINATGTVGGASTSAIDQANALSKLQYSMTHLTSTKSLF